MSIAEKLTQIAKNQQAVYDAGFSAGQAQGGGGSDDAFWDAYQHNGNRTDYQYAFYNWDGTCYNPKHPITGVIANAWRLSNFKGDTRISDTKVPIVASGSAANAFMGCTDLVTITSLDMTEVTNTANMFNNCTALVNITFEGDIKLGVDFAYSPLNSVSVQSIIDHLVDLTGQTAQTLKLDTAVVAKMTEAQKTAISAKNWTLASG